MQVVVVSSPGQDSALHWSHELARQVTQQAIERGGQVRWLAALHDGQSPPAGPTRGEMQVLRCGKLRPVCKVAANHRDAALELTLTRCLRDWPGAVVVHIGVGARGSPNVLWLGERLGSRTLACLRGAELVCARGDLVDRDGRPCTDHDDPERCRWCCTMSLRRRPKGHDLRNRTDLLAAGLLAADTVLVPLAADVAYLTELGVPPRRVAVFELASDLLDRIEAGPA